MNISSSTLRYTLSGNLVYRANTPTNNKTYSDNKSISGSSAAQEKKNNTWKYITGGLLFFAMIGDIIAERKIRLEDKAKLEALKNEKELLNKMFKEADEKSRKLEDDMEALNKLVESLNSDSKNEFAKYDYISKKIKEAKKRNSNNK